MSYPGQGVRFATVTGEEVILVDSVTWLDNRARDRIVVTGSHGGVYSAVVGASHRPRALLFNDAGVGKDAAGIAGLAVLARYGVAAAAVDCWSARIGDATDTLGAGVISHSNVPASACGVRRGMAASHAVALLATAPSPSAPPPAHHEEKVTRHEARVPVYVLDSASLVNERMGSAIVVTASHGGVIGGGALKHPVRAAFFNDAGIGKQDAGIGRLATLDKEGIPAAAVDCRSARIGDGEDTFGNGSVSRVNNAASRVGVRAGNAVADACATLASAILSGDGISQSRRSEP